MHALNTSSDAKRKSTVSCLTRKRMVQTIIFVVAIAFVAVTADQSKCLDGWIFFENSCYYLGDAGLNFKDARAACKDMDAELAIPSSRKENDYIKGLLQNDDATGAWFGFVNYKGANRVLYWDSLEFERQDFKDWPNNVEPYHRLPRGHRSGFIRCAAFSKQNDWAWGSFDCGDSTGMKYVCEKCPLEQVCTSRTCFRLLCKRDYHEYANEECEDLGGSLATIRSKKESEIVKKLLNQVSFAEKDWGKPGSDVWLAGSDEGSEGNWYWDINGQREKIPDVFNDWRKGEPNNAGIFGTDENCMSMTYGDWKWNDIECFSEKFMMCEIPNTQDVNPITG